MSAHSREWMLLMPVVAAVPALGAVSNELTHQGVIAVHGERFTGQGEFYFALVDELGYNLWTNDGTNIDPPSQECPDNPVTLTVVNGVYRVRLGHAPTVPIPRAVFNENDHVALRIWFNDGVHGVHQLSPDQVLTGAPYAQRLPNVFVDESTGNVGVRTTVPSNTLSVDGDTDITGRLGIGTSSPQNKLDVAGGAVVGSSYSGSAIAPLDGLLVGGSVGIGTTAPGSALSVVGDADFSGNVGIGTSTAGARLDVGAGDIHLDANHELFFSDNGQIRSYDDKHRILFRRDENKLELREYGDIVLSAGAGAGGETESVVVQSSGNVGIGTTAPAGKLDVNGDIRVKGIKPFIFQTVELVNSVETYDSGISSDEYYCAIAGFRAVNGDIDEVGNVHPIWVYTRVNADTETWWIYAHFAWHSGNPPWWCVDLMCVVKDLAEGEYTPL